MFWTKHHQDLCLNVVEETHMHCSCEVVKLDRDHKPMAVELKHIYIHMHHERSPFSISSYVYIVT